MNLRLSVGAVLLALGGLAAVPTMAAVPGGILHVVLDDTMDASAIGGKVVLDGYGKLPLRALQFKICSPEEAIFLSVGPGVAVSDKQHWLVESVISSERPSYVAGAGDTVSVVMLALARDGIVGSRTAEILRFRFQRSRTHVPELLLEGVLGALASGDRADLAAGSWPHQKKKSGRH